MVEGDLVSVFNTCRDRRTVRGIIVGFNEKGEGGKNFVHVLVDGEIYIFMAFDIEVVNENR